jgi:hypothetical protein
MLIRITLHPPTSIQRRLAAIPSRAKAAQALPSGNQQRGAKSMMSRSGAQAGVGHRIEWSIFAATAPLPDTSNTVAINRGGAPIAHTTGVLAKVISAIPYSGAGAALLVPGFVARSGSADVRAAGLAPSKVRAGTLSW